MTRALRSPLVRLIGYAAAFDGALAAGLVLAALAPIIPPALPVGVAAGYIAATLIYTHVLVATARPLDEGEPADRAILDAAARTAARLGLETPRVLQTSAGGGLLNAFATDLVLGPPAIVLTDRTALLTRRGAISPAALVGVISHELAHLAAGDSIPRGLLAAASAAVRVAAAGTLLLLPLASTREAIADSPARLAVALLAPLGFALLGSALERAGERRADEVARSLAGQADLGGFLRTALDERDEIATLRAPVTSPTEAAARIAQGRRRLAERIERINALAVSAHHPVGAAPAAPALIPSADPAARRLELAARLRALVEEVDARVAERVNRDVTRSVGAARRGLAAAGYRELASRLNDPTSRPGDPRPDPSRRAVEHLLNDLEAEAWQITALARSLRRLERAAGVELQTPLDRILGRIRRIARQSVRLWLGRLAMNRTHPPLDERLTSLER
jgi:Zn-dependent protease with chaperone function